MDKNNKQSRLEKIGIDYRQENIDTKRSGEYNYNDGNVYTSSHEDAKSHTDINHPLGKGTDTPIRDVNWKENAPNTDFDYGSIITKNGGGALDIQARNNMIRKNRFSAENRYGKDSVDISSGILKQWTNVKK